MPEGYFNLSLTNNTVFACEVKVMVEKSSPAVLVIVAVTSVPPGVIVIPVSGANETSAKSPLYTVDGIFFHLMVLVLQVLRLQFERSYEREICFGHLNLYGF